jgi:hypothetical protein
MSPGAEWHIRARFSAVDSKYTLIRNPRNGVDQTMSIERIKVRTENGQIMDVVVLSKRAGGIEIVLGEGVHNVKCTLTPTRNGLAYAGSVMGRELVYARSRDQVQADIDMLNPTLRKSRPR